MSNTAFQLLKMHEWRREQIILQEANPTQAQSNVHMAQSSMEQSSTKPGKVMPGTTAVVALEKLNQLAHLRSSTFTLDGFETLLCNNHLFAAKTKTINFLNFEPELKPFFYAPAELKQQKKLFDEVNICFLPLDWKSSNTANQLLPNALPDAVYNILSPASSIRFAFHASEFGAFESALHGFLGYSAPIDELDIFQMQYLHEVCRDLRLLFIPCVNSLRSLNTFLQTDGKYVLIGMPLGSENKDFLKTLKHSITKVPNNCSILFYCDNAPCLHLAQSFAQTASNALAVVAPLNFDFALSDF